MESGVAAIAVHLDRSFPIGAALEPTTNSIGSAQVTQRFNGVDRGVVWRAVSWAQTRNPGVNFSSRRAPNPDDDDPSENKENHSHYRLPS